MTLKRLKGVYWVGFQGRAYVLENLQEAIEWIEWLNTPKLSKIQEEYLKKPCPYCDNGELHEVTGELGNNGEFIENFLWCNTCDLSMDSSGGYTN